jgi:hemolysin activation/secretion protein
MTMLTSSPNMRPLALALLSQLAGLGPLALAQQAPTSAATASSLSVPAEPTLDIRVYRIEGSNPLSDAQTEQLLMPFTGAQRKLSQIEQAATALESAMRGNGYVFHRVFVPVQKPTDGEVTLQVIRFTVDKVVVNGNEHFSTENIRRSLPALQEGGVPDIREVGQDLSAANANPSKQLAVTFREASAADAVDAVLRVKDSDPLSTFVSYTGNLPGQAKNPDDSVSRLSFGIQHANLFDRDHVASFTYTTDPSKSEKVSLLGLYYQLPIYGTGLNVSAYYTSSDVASGLGSLGLPDVTGKGQFTGARLSYALPRIGPAVQTLSAALDDRHFDQGLPGTAMGSFPLSAKYAIRRDESWGGVGAHLEYAVNTSGGSDNNAASYTTQGADHDWEAWRAGLDASYRFTQWSVNARLRGQSSGSRLIAGEKLSLGGVGSVRGFTDAVVRGDSGYYWNLDATGPEMLAQLRPVLFLDGGQVQSNGAFAGHEELASVGAGLRWSYEKLDLSADLAYAAKANSAELQQDLWRFHLAAYYRF